MEDKTKWGGFDIVLLIVLLFTILFVIYWIIEGVAQFPKCQKEQRDMYIRNCCPNATDIDNDGYLSFEENNLIMGDFGSAFGIDCYCSGYHPQREINCFVFHKPMFLQVVFT